MSFVKELKIINEKPSRNNQRSIYDVDIPGGIRHCKWIEIDDKNALSIQASEFHYCIPRGLVSLDKYTHFEMALIYKGCLTTDFSILSDFEKLDELMECEDYGIFREVPKELIQDLYEHLKGRFSVMELMMIECCVCEEVFVAKNETGEHKCPKCDSKNYRYVFDEDVTEEELELVASVYKEIRDVFSNYGMDDVSNIKIIDLIMGK